MEERIREKEVSEEVVEEEEEELVTTFLQDPHEKKFECIVKDVFSKKRGKISLEEKLKGPVRGGQARGLERVEEAEEKTKEENVEKKRESLLKF